MRNIFAVFLGFILFSSTVLAQQKNPPTNGPYTPWEFRGVGKWKYVGTEQFGVIDSSSADQKKDMLEINSNGSYSKIENGQSSKGTYTLGDSPDRITFKDAATGKTKMYYLKKSTIDKFIIEYQTPDLIRTRYQFGKMQ